MEASTLQKKKNTISKGKLKKSLKNVLCRPDHLFWPEITAEQGLELQVILNKHKIQIPEYKKPHWNDIKGIPKEKRSKQPKLKKVDGLLFGINECSSSIQNCSCSAIVIESSVNPRMIVEPVVEMCKTKEIPVLCMKDLRKHTLINFGLKTSCLGIKADCLPDVYNVIMNIFKLYKRPKENGIINNKNVVNKNVIEKKEMKSDENKMEVVDSPYLYRTNKKTRVFTPSTQENGDKTPKKFIGQDFIQLSTKLEDMDRKSYMKMILKRISNNPDRVKKK